MKTLEKLRKRAKSNNKGFSLVELIIVIAIMAVLVGVLAPQYIKYVEKSRVAADETNIDELKKAFEVIAADGTEIDSNATIVINHDETTADTKISTQLAEMIPEYAKKKLTSKRYTTATITYTYTAATTTAAAKYAITVATTPTLTP